MSYGVYMRLRWWASPWSLASIPLQGTFRAVSHLGAVVCYVRVFLQPSRVILSRRVVMARYRDRQGLHLHFFGACSNSHATVYLGTECAFSNMKVQVNKQESNSMLTKTFRFPSAYMQHVCRPISSTVPRYPPLLLAPWSLMPLPLPISTNPLHTLDAR
jgi:hypothetical protein